MHVTVCICTRDRGASITRTLRSVAALDYPDFDVLILDQSTRNDTEWAVRSAIAGDARFTYRRSRTRGLSTARNLLIAQAHGPIIAFTDDDCEVARDWLAHLTAAFRKYPDVGQICGPVVAAPHDKTAGFIPTSDIRRLRRITTPWLAWRDRGIGANMSFRLEALWRVGPFDEALSPGGPLYTCDDIDMTYRMLRAGYSVLDLPGAPVIHSGFRAWREARKYIREVGTAIGACYTKHLRLGDLAAAPTLLHYMQRPVVWRRLLTLRRRCGIRFVYACLCGIWRSWEYAIMPRPRRYLVAPQRAASSSALTTKIRESVWMSSELVP